MQSKAIAHPNIALVKYWGKENEAEITPIHGSLSVTLDFGSTETIASYSDSDEFTLNGKTANITSRLQTAITFFKKYSDKAFSVSSTNNFPTAAGFASSASGAAAFVGALASLVGETESPIEYWKERNVNLSSLSRKVSGSGCRSMFGGFVEWLPGSPEESVSKQVFDENHWDDFRVISVTLEPREKLVSSTRGMQQTLETVPWVYWRAKEVVPKRIEAAKQFIETKNFESLSDIIMKESNDLHANCAATFPPIYYMNDVSRAVVAAIHRMNEETGRTVAAYSFDAGSNPFVFVKESDLEFVKQQLLSVKGVQPESFRVAKPCEGLVCKLL